MNKNGNGILRATLGLTLAMISVKILGVAFKIPISYLIGDVGMGYFNAAYTIYGFFYIIAASGIPKSIALSSSRGTQDLSGDAMRRISKKLLLLTGLIGLSLTLGVAVFSKSLSLMLGNPKAHLTILLISPAIFLVFISGVLRGYLNGRCEFSPLAVSQVIEAVSKLVIGVTLAMLGARLGYSTELIAALSITGITIGGLISDLYLYRKAYNTKAQNEPSKFSGDDSPIIIEVLKNAVPLTLASSGISLFNILEVGIIINGLIECGLEKDGATALYGNYSTLAVPMITLVNSILAPLAITFLPKLVHGYELRDKSSFVSAFSAFYKITLIISLPITVMYLLYSFDILDILFPSYNSSVGYMTLSLLAPIATLSPLLTAINTALEASKRIMAGTMSIILGLILRIIILSILITDMRYGILAAPIANTASYVFSTVFSLIFVSSTRGIKFRHLLPFAEIGVPLLLYTSTHYIFYLSGIFGTGFFALIISAGIPSLIYFPIALIRVKQLMKQIT